MHDLTQYAISLLIFFILVNYFVVKKFLINTKRIKNRADYERVVEELRERKEHYEKIINTINECIITINDKDIIIDCNKASKLIFNYEPEELLGKSIDFIVKDKLIPNVIITAECKTKDGKGIFVDISCAEAKEPKEKVIFAVTRNMTNQRNMFQEIKILNETLSVRVDALKGFQYTISHDLNGPLRHIEGYSQILEEDYAPQLNKEGIEVIKKIRSSAKFLVQLVKDIMRLSEISDGKIKVNKIDFNLSFMIKSIIDDLIKTNEKEVLVKVANDVVCHGDKNLVEIAVTNLLHNAVNFSSKKEFSKIEFGKFFREGEIIYYVQDNGVGFDMSQYEKLFCPFSRLHSKKDFSGTGIGLTIVKQIITLHGGRVWAKSEIDKGATFYFTLGEKTSGQPD